MRHFRKITPDLGATVNSSQWWPDGKCGTLENAESKATWKRMRNGG